MSSYLSQKQDPKTVQPSKRDQMRIWSYGVAAIMGGGITIALLFPSPSQWLASGPPNTGHEKLECAECHQVASGTIRQRTQAIVKHAIGLRNTGASIMYEPVTNRECVACHIRDHDQHAPHLFNEPRFKEARRAADPRECVSCHAEHQGVRVTRDGTECRFCHEDLVVKRDSIDPSHTALIHNKEWESCLRCHDYHGGHDFESPTDHRESIDRSLIDSYLKGNLSSPYGPSMYPSRPLTP